MPSVRRSARGREPIDLEPTEQPEQSTEHSTEQSTDKSKVYLRKTHVGASRVGNPDDMVVVGPGVEPRVEPP